MPGRTRAHYLSLRQLYEPPNLKLVIIAESPPASGLYFYDGEGTPGEPLFAALMKQLGLSTDTKEDGLRAFQQSGWLLVDATYEAVNGLSAPARNAVIERDYPLLVSDLRQLMSSCSCPVVLIKATVCRLLERKLVQDGFDVLNRECVVYFPASGRQPDFHRQFGEIRKAAGI